MADARPPATADAPIPGPGAATGFARHVEACNNALLPGGRARLLLAGQAIGWVAPGLAPGLLSALGPDGLRADAAGDLVLAEAGLLQVAAERLAAQGRLRLRGEAFDILAGPGSPSLGRIDRGALPAFGLVAAGVHVNGLVRTRATSEAPASPEGPGSGLSLWVGRRAANKQLDPGKLDQLIGGGVAAGYTPGQTLFKEGTEECSLPTELGERAVKVAELSYRMQRPEGLRRDILHCFDLMLPADWQPVPNDGEVEQFQLMPLEHAFALVRDTDEFKFNVNLVLIDLFLRHGLIDPSGEEGRRLRAGLHAPL